MAVDQRSKHAALRQTGPHTELEGAEAISLGRSDARWGTSLDREATTDARVERAIRRATGGGGMADVDPGWMSFLTGNLQVVAFLTREESRVLDRAADRCQWGPVGRNLGLQAAMLARQSQAVVLYAIDLEAISPGVPLDQARAQWMGGRAWQPARRMLEALSVREDWAELLVAVNVCFEPLVGQLIRFEWASRLAGHFGDQISPIVAEATQIQQAWVRDWTHEALRSVLDDPRHGAHNRALVERWIATWTPHAQAAAAALTELTGALADPERGREALARVTEDQQAVAASVLGGPIEERGT